MTKEVIEQMQDQIEALLARHLKKSDHNQIIQTLLDLSTYLGTGAKCITEAKRLELTKKGEHLRKYEEKINGMKPSMAKEFIATACIEYQILSLRCDRNYSALCKAGENLRTAMSTIKAEMQMNNAA